ncbi:MAG: DUF2064 domain-containing protein [Bacteroidota bacterium]
MTQSKTGILFFSRNPFQESRHKQVHKDREKNFKALHLMYDGVKKAIAGSEIPAIELGHQLQSGNSFAERMCEGLKSLFAQGFDQLIVIGNDCPHLEAEDLLLAKKELLSGKSVIGYEKDGGAYLFALSKENFDEQAFLQLPWQSENLGQALFDYLSSDREIIELEEKEDIDNVEDLLWLVLSLRISQILLLLRKLFNTAFKREKELPIHYSRLPGPEQSLRAPPFSLSL